MSRRLSLAPTLRANILANAPGGWKGTEPLEDMRLELRALLAVVSAAERFDAEWHRAGDLTAVNPERVEPITRALARLRKVSGRKP